MNSAISGITRNASLEADLRVVPEFLLDKPWEQSYVSSLTLKPKEQKDRIYMHCEGDYEYAAVHDDQGAVNA